MGREEDREEYIDNEERGRCRRKRKRRGWGSKSGMVIRIMIRGGVGDPATGPVATTAVAAPSTFGTPTALVGTN